jgi:hypothetical protein
VNLATDDAADPPPAMPREPEAGTCCQSGCDPCVYDLYWAAVDRYEQALADWNSRNAARLAIGGTRSQDAI